MARVATDAELLAVENAAGREVTREGLALACAVVQVARMEAAGVDDLPEWREGRG